MKDYELVTDYRKLLELAPQLKEDIDSYQEPFLFFVDGTPTIIGEIQITKIDVYVKMVRSLEQGLGHGKEFIYYLKGLPGKHEIWGESVESAIPFWRKMGAVFDSIVYKYYERDLKEGKELEEDFLLPFMIHCEK
jgi:hypothetical protein